jgi:flagellar motor switch protein FliM
MPFKEADWSKAEFKSYGNLQGPSGNLVRMANETLARELSVSLSAFLRTSVIATYTDGGEIPFSQFPVDDSKSCFGLVLIRPGQRKLLLELGYSILYPLVGVALGAKAGSFASPERKPTDIELQVVSLLFRLILSDAYRSWTNLVKAQLETVTLEIEHTPARALPPAEPVFAARFELALGEQLGTLVLLAPPDLFASLAEDEDQRGKRETSGSVETTLELVMTSSVALDVWLDGSQMRLGELLQLREGQILRLDHPVERRAVCTLNGRASFIGQVVSTGMRRAFQVEDFTG